MKISVTILICIFFFISSCTKKEDTKTEERESSIIRTNLPDSLRLGNHINIKFVFGIENGCGEYSRNEISSQTRELRVKIFSKYRTGNIVCTQIYREDSVTYSYFPNIPGKYYFHLGNGNGGFELDSMLVY